MCGGAQRKCEMGNTLQWLSYHFHVCDYYGDWKEVGGVYIFTGFNLLTYGWQHPSYIGESGNFRKRMADHEKWNRAVALGATHVHAMVVEQESQRIAIEQELIQAYDPPLNDKLRLRSPWEAYLPYLK